MTDAALGPSHIAPRTIDATQPLRRGLASLDRQTIEIGVVVGGSVFMAIVGMTLGSYLMLPFGS